MLAMNQKPKGAAPPLASPDQDDQLAPITAMMSSRLIVLANLLKRGAILRYKRLAGLSSVEFGLVASLGRRPPMSVVSLAEAVGIDKGQISRALAGLVSRKLVSRAVNPRDNREVLVGLTRTGLIAHETIVAGALERNQRLLQQLGKDEVAVLLEQIDRLTDTAAKMLEAEKDAEKNLG
jgi:DNA-binding MarR family transcriptional regulator